VDLWQTAQRLALGVMRRRKRLALVSSLAALLALLSLAYSLSKEPPRYRTSAVIFLEARPSRTPVFQEMSPHRPLPVQLAILRSRSLADTVVESLPRASFNELLEVSYRVDYWDRIVNAYLRWRGITPEAPDAHRRAVVELRTERVTFEARNDGSGLVTISAEASRPDVSAGIVTAYIEALMARTRTFNIDDARVSREFLEQQVGDVKRTLKASEQALQSFVVAHGGVRLPDKARVTADQLTSAEAGLAEAATNRKMLQTRLDALREKIGSQKRSGDSSKISSGEPRVLSQDVQRLRNQFAQLEASLLDLRAKYTEEHPRIRVIKDRLDELRRQLGDAVKDSVVTTPAAISVPTEERVNFAEQLVALEVDYHAVTAQEEALRKRAEALRQSLAGLSGGESEYARLTREVESQRALYAQLSDKLSASRIREQGEMKVVKVVDPPSHPAPVPGKKQMTAYSMALALALCVGGGVPAFVEWLRRKVEDEDDVRLATGLPVLAVVPRVRVGHPLFQGGVTQNGRGSSEHVVFSEAFRTLRVGIELGTRTQRLRSLLVTSAVPGEGKSTVLVNLGFALHEGGRRVVVADTDFLRPTLHRAMKVKSSAGLVETLQTDQPLEQALTPVTEGLWLAQRGQSFQLRSRGMLGGAKLRELIGEMTNRADFVLCDSSPVLVVPDNLLLAGAVDGVVLVAQSGVTGFGDLARAKTILEAAGARMVGVVLNQAPARTITREYRRYYASYTKSDRH
jgi:succinoglycan biosynthesis transport protein ExoP